MATIHLDAGMTAPQINGAIAGVDDNDRVVIPAGEYAITEPVTFHCNVDADNEALFRVHEDAFVQIGNGTERLSGKTLNLPRCWGVSQWPTGSALILYGLHECRVIVPSCYRLETGLKLTGNAATGGMADCTVMVDNLNGNKVNILLQAATGGWVNQNRIIGGKSVHDAANGGVGTIGLHIDGTNGLTDENTVIGMNLEGNHNEWQLVLNGKNNHLIDCRFETHALPEIPRVQFGPLAKDNHISGGSYVDKLEPTVEAGATGNLWSRVKDGQLTVWGGDVRVATPGKTLVILDATGNPMRLVMQQIIAVVPEAV